MKLQFRETSPQDAPAVAAFLQRIFDIPPEVPLIAPRHLHWKNWEPRSEWPGSRGYVMAKEEVIAAHGTVVPVSCVSGPRRLRIVHLIDWAADPKSVGSGVTIMKQIARLADAIIAVGGSEMTQKVLPAFGFKTYGEVTHFALPLRPLRRLAGQKLSPRLGAQFARSLWWSLQAPPLRAPGWTVTRVAPDHVQSCPIPWPRPVESAAILERTAETLAYLLRCPATPMDLYTAAKDGAIRGYFLLAHAPGQTRIVDFHVDSEDRASWRTLIQLAVAQARRNPDAAEVVSVGSELVTQQALLDSGFHTRGSFALRILPGKGGELPSRPLRYHMIDSDAAYLHAGKDDYWA